MSTVDEDRRRKFVEGLKDITANAYLHGGMDALDLVQGGLLILLATPEVSVETRAALAALHEHIEAKILEMQLALKEDPGESGT